MLYAFTKSWWLPPSQQFRITGVTKFGLEKVFIAVQFFLVGMDEQYSK